MIGRFCEEFHCLPSAAWREWQRLPAGFLETIIEMREYAKAKRIYESARSRTDVPSGPLFDLVQTFDFDLARLDIEARRG